MVADLTYLQAWQLWFDNVQVTQDTLYGWPILALGRAGKVVAFLSGMTVVLDVIGPERLREFGAKHKRYEAGSFQRLDRVISGFFGAGALGLLVLALVIVAPSWRPVVLPLGMGLILSSGVGLVLSAVLDNNLVIRVVARLLERPKAERIVRWLAVLGLAIGFHFDLLAS